MNLATLERPRATIRLENQIAELVSQNATGEARTDILLKVAIDMLPPHAAKRELLESILTFQRSYDAHGIRRDWMDEGDVEERGNDLFNCAAGFMRHFGHDLAPEGLGI